MKMVILTALGVGGATILGAVIGFIFKKVSHKFSDIVLSFAAGVMLAAAVLGLILPSLEHGGDYSLLITVAGVFAGAVCLNLMDKLIPHMHRMAGVEDEQHPDAKLSKVLLFVTAIAIHNLPEGVAAGVSFGSDDTTQALMIAGGIALQNIPEAMVIIVPLLAIGVSIRRTLLISGGIGLISMVSTVAGVGLVSVMQNMLPLILSLAGGAMLYVISDEMIPETHAHGYEKQATFSLIAGFMLIVVLQQLLP